jgi:Domain of unknown function (DUF4157)
MKAVQQAAPQAATPAPQDGGRLLQRKCGCGGSAPVGGECEDCKGKKKLQRKSTGGSAPSLAPPIVSRVLGSSGSPLDSGTRGFMESRIGYNFGGVRVHADSLAAESARAVNAAAYTVGRDVVFGAGQYAPSTSAGRQLLAHELAHVAQQRGGEGIASGPIRIADEPSLEAEADRSAERATSGTRRGDLSHAAVQRAPAAGWTNKSGKPETGVNAAEKSVKGLKRIPIEGITRGNQDASADATGQSAAGRAVVYLPDSFDATRGTQVLIHFHGWNSGYRTTGKTAQDEKIKLPDQIAADISSRSASADRAQLIAILPQGTSKAKFGKNAGGTPGFDSDGYIGEVLSRMVTHGYFAKEPTVSKVLLTGHSGSGEMINELMLGPGVGLPSKLGAVFLYDAVNGPNEFHAVLKWLDRTLAAELAAITALPSDADKLKFLAESMRFRLYASDADKEYYTKWAVGLKSTGKTPKNEAPVRDVLDAWFTKNASALGGANTPVFDAMRKNYQVITTGHADHEAVISKGDRLKESLATVQRSSDVANAPAVAPPSVHGVLKGGGSSLDGPLRTHAESRLGYDFSGVRVHTGDAAAESARQIRARAYTVGQHVVFGAGQYAPASPAGRSLALHELAHTVQQRSARSIPSPGSLRIGPSGDTHEREASRAARDGSMPTTRVAASVIQREPLQGSLRAITCEGVDKDKADKAAVPEGTCIYSDPAACGTYGEWVETFLRLRTFRARANPTGGPTEVPGPRLGTTVKHSQAFDVIGGDPALRDDSDTDKKLSDARKKVKGLEKGKKGESDVDKTTREGELTKAKEELEKLEGITASPRIGSRRTGEEFIDHPTNEWVKNCLPPNLRPTAYQLPSDCADIALILRHVWLSAHRRTEVVGKFVIGDKAGGPQTNEVSKAIEAIYTGNVGQMATQYADAEGNPILSFAELSKLIHPGDVLVWEHRDGTITGARTGGHTLTVTRVDRDGSGNVTAIAALQGNLPIFGDADPIPKTSTPGPDDDKGQIIRKQGVADTKGYRTALGNSPGRRIEATEIPASRFTDTALPAKKGETPKQIWTWDGHTFLTAAGPPKAAKRVGKQKGNKKRMITDWTASFKSASADSIVALFEAMLVDTRTLIELGETVSATDAATVGETAGQRVWSMAKKAGDTGNQSHFFPLTEMRLLLRGIRNSRDKRTDTGAAAVTTSLKNALDAIDTAFETAARGGNDVGFKAKVPKGKSLMKFLVTGFDPFGDIVGGRPGRGAWNPSGAAALALDGKTFTVDKNVVAVESLVFPVVYGEFDQDIAEKLIKPHVANVDAILTVSMDASITVDKPVRLEKYLVGVRIVQNSSTGTNQIVSVPAASGGAEGAAIAQTGADLDKIRANTAERAGTKDKPALQKPDIGKDVTLTFPDSTKAQAAVTALGNGTVTGNDATFTSDAAITAIISGTTKRTGTSITFKVGTATFTANVKEGPGGNFLSNEISFRMQRLLGAPASPTDPISFHTHVQGGNTIADSGAARRDSLKEANKIRKVVIETMENIIKATAKTIADARAASSGTNP